MDRKKRSLWSRIKDVALLDVGVLARGGPDKNTLEQLEEVLLEADLGVTVTSRLVEGVERLAKRGEVKTPDAFRDALAADIESALRAGNSESSLVRALQSPTVIMVLGVNGAGKTTFIGKLSSALKRDGHRVLVAAADTFRAGAIDQLRVWAERTGVEFVGGKPGGDPAAVGFDAIDAAIARGCDTVIVDTAGRLHTSDALMEELKKVHRVIAKRLSGAPHESLLVLDGTIGQNAIVQAKSFAAAVPVTGLVVTKLDGTAKGGVVVAVHDALNVPIKFIGVGESVNDLERFDAARFARSLLNE
ncbi:MAG TPA: signal recognition particle-docking protein FtsY [Gemmatimonadaceae bacterium]|nr:signal recognition particle-docking protein FtsY [Gemmatimonadaceae bacterium]